MLIFSAKPNGNYFKDFPENLATDPKLSSASSACARPPSRRQGERGATADRTTLS